MTKVKALKKILDQIPKNCPAEVFEFETMDLHDADKVLHYWCHCEYVLRESGAWSRKCLRYRASQIMPAEEGEGYQAYIYTNDPDPVVAIVFFDPAIQFDPELEEEFEPMKQVQPERERRIPYWKWKS